MNDETLRYPIGRFTPQEAYTEQELGDCIQRIESLPHRIDFLIKSFSPRALDRTYRDGGWSGRQVIHHLSDSHINAYIRLKWTLTENTPLIKAYDEKRWAETPEVKLDPAISLDLLKALHAKWVGLLKSLTTTDLQREYTHPETKKNVRLDRLLAMYAWHGDHHLGHLKIIGDKSIE